MNIAFIHDKDVILREAVKLEEKLEALNDEWRVIAVKSLDLGSSDLERVVRNAAENHGLAALRFEGNMYLINGRED